MLPEEYRTSDLYFAAFLKTAKCHLKKCDVDKRNKITFVFESNPRIQDLLLGWTNRTEKVSALDYADNIKNLKSLCHMTLEELAKKGREK